MHAVVATLIRGFLNLHRRTYHSWKMYQCGNLQYVKLLDSKGDPYITGMNAR